MSYEEKQMGRALNATAPQEHQAMQVFRQWCDAQQEFTSACHNLIGAQARREKAAAMIQDLSQKISQAVDRGLQDPTVPQPPSQLGNGLAQGFAGSPAVRY